MTRRLLACAALFVLAGCSAHFYDWVPQHSAANVCGDLAVFVTQPASHTLEWHGVALLDIPSGPDYITAVDLHTGEITWRYQRGHVISRETYHKVSVRPPVIDGTTAYVWQDGRPCAIDCLTGEQRWYARQAARCRPGGIVVAGRVVLFSGSPDDREHTTLCAYDKESGEALWARAGVRMVARAEGRIFAFQDPGSAAGRGTRLIGLDPQTGNTLWETPAFPAAGWLPVPSQVGHVGANLGDGAANVGGAVASERAVVVAGVSALSGYAHTYTVRCFEAATGQLLWNKDITVRGTNPYWHRGVALFLADLRCYILISQPTAGGKEIGLRVCDLLTGEELKEATVEFVGFEHCLLMRDDAVPELVLVPSPLEEPFRVLAFDAETGSLLREFCLPAESKVRRQFRSFSTVGETLFAGGWEVGPDTHVARVLYQFDLRSGEVVWSQMGEPKAPR